MFSIHSSFSIKDDNQSSTVVPPPNTEVTSFDWNSLIEPFLPTYIPFQIMVELFSRSIHWTIIDEGASISILSSTTWQALGSPNLMPANGQISTFNRSTTYPVGIVPQ